MTTTEAPAVGVADNVIPVEESIDRILVSAGMPVPLTDMPTARPAVDVRVNAAEEVVVVRVGACPTKAMVDAVTEFNEVAKAVAVAPGLPPTV